MGAPDTPADLAEQALQRTTAPAAYGHTVHSEDHPGHEAHEESEHEHALKWPEMAIGVDEIGILLAAFGLLNPLFAAFIHVASELTFILNSARSLPADTGRHRSFPVTASAGDSASAPARS